MKTVYVYCMQYMVYSIRIPFSLYTLGIRIRIRIPSVYRRTLVLYDFPYKNFGVLGWMYTVFSGNPGEWYWESERERKRERQRAREKGRRFLCMWPYPKFGQNLIQFRPSSLALTCYKNDDFTDPKFCQRSTSKSRRFYKF
jgi:hypothetical protein